MTIAAAIFLIAVGAILRYATNINIEGVSLDTVGLILMIAGGAGLILGFLQEMIWSDRRKQRDQARQEQAERERADLERREPPPPPPRY